MSGKVIDRDRCMEGSRQYPLSETLAEVEDLFSENLELVSKFPEQTIANKLQPRNEDYALGCVFKYKDSEGQELYIYLGLVYFMDSVKIRCYPSGFFFGTDFEDEKLDEFLEKIQENLRYINRKNVLDTHYELSGGTYVSTGSTFLSCVESHKMRKKGLYKDAISLPLGSKLQHLKEILDK